MARLPASWQIFSAITTKIVDRTNTGVLRALHEPVRALHEPVHEYRSAITVR